MVILALSRVDRKPKPIKARTLFVYLVPSYLSLKPNWVSPKGKPNLSIRVLVSAVLYQMIF